MNTRHTSKRWLKALCGLAIMGLIAAACGDDDTSVQGGTTTAAPATDSSSTTPSTVADITTTSSDVTTTSAQGPSTTAGASTTTTKPPTNSTTKPTTGTTQRATTTTKPPVGPTSSTTAPPLADTPIADSKTVAEYLTNLKAFYQNKAAQYITVPAKADGTTNRGVTDDKILLGGVISGVVGTTPIFPGMCEGAMARFDRANREGGVGTTKKRFIEYVTKVGEGYAQTNCLDDNTNRDRNRTLLTQLIEDKQAFAIVPMTSTGFSANDYMTQQHAPYFGYAVAPDFCAAQYGFSAQGAVLGECLNNNKTVATDLSLTAIIKAKLPGINGKPDVKWYVLATDDATGKAAVVTLKQSTEQSGATWVGGNSNFPPAAAPQPTDLGPYINQVTAGNPNVIYVAIGAGSVVPFVRALRAANYNGFIIQAGLGDERAIFGTPAVAQAMEGVVTLNPFAANYKTGGTSFSQMRADLDNIGFRNLLINNNLILGYANADLFIQALNTLPEPLTAEALTNKVNAGFDYQGFGDAACPATFPLNKYMRTPCMSVVIPDKNETNDLARINVTGTGGFRLPFKGFDYVNLAIFDRVA